MTRSSAVFPLMLGFGSVALLIGGVGVWSVTAEISGAVVAPAMLKIENDRQIVQHPEGGVVGEILAREGEEVEAGDVLMRLDSTFLLSELAIVETQIAELFARSARLKAERDGAEAPDFSQWPDLTTVPDHMVRELMDGQAGLFEATHVTYLRAQGQLREQIIQVERQIDGLMSQLASLERQLELISNEIETTRNLFERGLTQSARLTQLLREEAELLGEIGQQKARAAEAGIQITRLEIEATRLTEERRERAIARLRDIDLTRLELSQRRVSLVERIGRLDIRAPVSGVVFDSRVAAVRSVVQPAEPMMFIVPRNRPLQVTARINPNDIDHIHVGQDASLVFTTFARQEASEIVGTVSRISADTVIDPADGAPFYEAVIVPDTGALPADRQLRLRPGMPVEVFLQTKERTPLSYFTQPLTRYLKRAFREN